MAFKGFFKAIKKEVKNELTKQIDKSLGGGGASTEGGLGAIQKVDMNLVEGVLGLLGGGDSGSGGGGSGGLGQLINAIQGAGGFLPGGIGKFLPGILKVAEIIAHGQGDDTPRNEKRADGSSIDDFIRTIVGGRKIHGGKSMQKVMPVDLVSNLHFSCGCIL